MEILKELFLHSDEKFRDFSASLMPTVLHENVIGVKTPVLRALAKKLYKSEDALNFMQSLPHKYFEENNLHAFLICEMRDFDECISALERFLPYVDNWATCDQMSPKVLKSNTKETLRYAKKWIKSKHTYTVRYGIGMLMRYFLDDDFNVEYAEIVASVKSDDYYVKMMQSWYFATALAKQYEKIIPYFTEGYLEPFVHNKSIQKAVESFRINDETKKYLRTLKYVKVD